MLVLSPSRKDQKLLSVRFCFCYCGSCTPNYLAETGGLKPAAGLMKARQKQCGMCAGHLAYFILVLPLISPATWDQSRNLFKSMFGCINHVSSFCKFDALVSIWPTCMCWTCLVLGNPIICPSHLAWASCLPHSLPSLLRRSPLSRDMFFQYRPTKAESPLQPSPLSGSYTLHH